MHLSLCPFGDSPPRLASLAGAWHRGGPSGVPGNVKGARNGDGLMFRKLSDHVLASPQIDLADIAAAAAQGVTLIINNRPEGESEDQTPGAEIEAAAKAAGLAYVSIPVTHAGFSEAQVRAMAEA